MSSASTIGNQFDRRPLHRLYLARQHSHAEAQSSRIQEMEVQLNDITGAIIETAIEIHRSLGPGLLESVYRKVLAYELRKKGFEVLEEWPIPVEWDNMRLEIGFRADLIVNGLVLVELKSVEKAAPVHKKTLLTYLRMTDKRVGLLINFGEELLKNGIHRIANNYVEEDSRRGAEVAENSNTSASSAPLRETIP
jgi:GxxExxY protein